jgi:hypothetical protein
VGRRDILFPVILKFFIFTFFIFSCHEWNSIGLLMPFINFWWRWMEGHVRRAGSKRNTHRYGLTTEIVVSLPLSPSQLMNIRRDIPAHGVERCYPMSQSCSHVVITTSTTTMWCGRAMTRRGTRGTSSSMLTRACRSLPQPPCWITWVNPEGGI